MAQATAVMVPFSSAAASAAPSAAALTAALAARTVWAVRVALAAAALSSLLLSAPAFVYCATMSVKGPPLISGFLFYSPLVM